ncbi:hypothetical protein PS2_002295 [Malus domestica]
MNANRGCRILFGPFILTLLGISDGGLPPEPVDLSGGSSLELVDTDGLVEADPTTGAGSGLIRRRSESFHGGQERKWEWPVPLWPPAWPGPFHNMPYLVSTSSCSLTAMNNHGFYYCSEDDYDDIVADSARAAAPVGEEEQWSYSWSWIWTIGLGSDNLLLMGLLPKPSSSGLLLRGSRSSKTQNNNRD